MVGVIVIVGDVMDEERDLHTNLFGERNYCIICQIKKTFNLDKIYNLDKIQQVFNNFLSLKKELQIFLNNGYRNFWLYHYISL